jgi:hypothetical protein
METFDLSNRTFADKTDGQVTYTGPSVPELGITQGDPVATVLMKIIANTKPMPSIKAISDKLDNLTVDDLVTTAPTLDLGTSSSAAAAQILNKGYTLDVKEDGNYSKITYSMKDTTDNIPKGYRVVSSGLTVQGAQSRSLIVSTKGSSGEVKILPTQYPVLLNFRVGLDTPSGSVQLTRTKALQAPTSISTGGSLTVEDLTSPTESFLSQKEFNTRMASELSKLKQRIEDLERNGIT